MVQTWWYIRNISLRAYLGGNLLAIGTSRIYGILHYTVSGQILSLVSCRIINSASVFCRISGWRDFPVHLCLLARFKAGFWYPVHPALLELVYNFECKCTALSRYWLVYSQIACLTYKKKSLDSNCMVLVTIKNSLAI